MGELLAAWLKESTMTCPIHDSFTSQGATASAFQSDEVLLILPRL